MRAGLPKNMITSLTASMDSPANWQCENSTQVFPYLYTKNVPYKEVKTDWKSCLNSTSRNYEELGENTKLSFLTREIHQFRQNIHFFYLNIKKTWSSRIVPVWNYIEAAAWHTWGNCDTRNHIRFACRQCHLNSMANCTQTCILYLPLVTQCMIID